MQKIQFHKLSFWVNVFTKWAHSVGIQVFFSFRQDLCLLIGSFSTQKCVPKSLISILMRLKLKKPFLLCCIQLKSILTLYSKSIAILYKDKDPREESSIQIATGSITHTPNIGQNDLTLLKLVLFDPTTNIVLSANIRSLFLYLLAVDIIRCNVKYLVRWM